MFACGRHGLRVSEKLCIDMYVLRGGEIRGGNLAGFTIQHRVA